MAKNVSICGVIKGMDVHLLCATIQMFKSTQRQLLLQTEAGTRAFQYSVFYLPHVRCYINNPREKLGSGVAMHVVPLPLSFGHFFFM